MDSGFKCWLHPQCCVTCHHVTSASLTVFPVRWVSSARCPQVIRVTSKGQGAMVLEGLLLLVTCTHWGPHMERAHGLFFSGKWTSLVQAGRRGHCLFHGQGHTRGDGHRTENWGWHTAHAPHVSVPGSAPSQPFLGMLPGPQPWQKEVSVRSG